MELLELLEKNYLKMELLEKGIIGKELQNQYGSITKGSHRN